MLRKIFMAIAAITMIRVQAQDVEKLLESARTFSKQNDFDNALLVLNKAAQMKPGDLAIQRELAYMYYRSGNYREALPTVQALTDREDADVPCFQIAANVYKGIGDPKECEKVYKKGLKKFPNSGALYFEYGELMLTQQQTAEAIRLWEKGIDTDPSYPGNYYHAGKYYYYTGTNPALSLVYSEIFLNMESYTVRTAEMKNVLLDAYKKFFLQKADPQAGKRRTVGFQQSVSDLLMEQSDLASLGITAESLTMIRTRFLMAWQERMAGKYPHKLFEQQQFLLREGMFEAYNQWIFGPASNMAQYQQWANTNAGKMNDFSYYQKNRVFRMPPGQNYQ